MILEFHKNNMTRQKRNFNNLYEITILRGFGVLGFWGLKVLGFRI